MSYSMKRMAAGSLVVVLGVAAALAEEAKAPPKPWSTAVAVGANVARGNSKSLLLNGSVVTDYKAENNVLHVGAEGCYGEAEVTVDGQKETQANAENSRAFAEYKRLVSERAYLNFNSELRNDDLAGIDYRLIVGPGFGYYLLRSDRQQLSADAGVAYIRERLEGVEDDKMALRLAERYDLKLSPTAKTWEAVEYLPAFDDFGNYLLNAEVGIEAAVNAHLNLRLVAQDKYFSKATDEGKKDNDLAVVASLVLNL